MRFECRFIIAFLLASSAAQAQKRTKEPFWRAKPEVYRQVVEERRVFVSVRDVSTESEDQVRQMKLSGGGQIAAPKKFAFEKVQDFRTLFKNNSYVKKLEVNEKDRTLSLRAQAYGLWSSMKIHWDVEKDTKDYSAIQFKIIAGLMEGFQWTLYFEPAQKNRTDVGIEGLYEYSQFPLPSFFLKFGLEIIFQRLAIEIRSVVEESFKNE